MKFNFWSKSASLPAPKLQTNHNNEFGFFGYLFQRIEILLLILMAFMAYNMHTLFVDYISKNATFIGDKDGQFYFATRLIGSLLLVEIILALGTAYFRSRNEWDKSLFTAIIALAIAIANHFTILELFKDFADAISPEARTAIEWKMIITNALVFLLGEAIGFVMHSKGQGTKSETQEASILEKIENTLQRFNASPTAHNGLYDNVGNPITAQYEPPQAQPMQTVIGFQMKGNIAKQGKGGRPPITPQKIAEVKMYLNNGYSMRQTAKACNVSLHKVTEIKNTP